MSVMATFLRIARWPFKFLPSSKVGKLYVISTLFTFLAILLSIVLATKVYALQEVSYNVPLTGNSTARKIVMATDYIDIDPIVGTLTADWYPIGDDCKNPEEVVNIYFDRNLLISPEPDPGQIPSDKPSEQPVFQFNTRTRCRANIRDSLSTFRTIAKLVGESTNKKLTGPSLQWYPLDIYFAQFSLFAELNSTKESVGIVTASPFGSPVNFRVNLNYDSSRNTDQGLYLRLDVKRSIGVRFLVFIIVFANWLATVAFLWITVASLLWPENVVKELFVIPIATLFAFSSVRSNMPGAPAGFGAFMDFVGILPNIAAMAIFSAVLLFVVLIRRTRTGLSEDESTSTRVEPLEDHKRASLPLTSPPNSSFSILEKERMSAINSMRFTQPTLSGAVPAPEESSAPDAHLSQVPKPPSAV